MNYFKEAREISQSMYGYYCEMCRKLGITPVYYHDFKTELHDAVKLALKLNFKPKGKFYITGRGNVHTINITDYNDLTLNLLSIMQKNEIPITSENKKFLIKGIETFAQPLSIIQYSNNVGLLVKEL